MLLHLHIQCVCLLLQDLVLKRYHSNTGVSFSSRRVPQIWRSQSGCISIAFFSRDHLFRLSPAATKAVYMGGGGGVCGIQLEDRLCVCLLLQCVCLLPATFISPAAAVN
jgi:hypothetical protein